MIGLFGKKGTKIELTVRGMTCGHCEMRVQKALLGVAGVRDAKASHERGRVVITLDPGAEVRIEDLVAAVQAAGYEAEA